MVKKWRQAKRTTLWTKSQWAQRVCIIFDDVTSCPPSSASGVIGNFLKSSPFKLLHEVFPWTGVGTSCSNTGLFGEMGWVSFQAEIKFSIIKFWHRIWSLPTHRLPNIMHRWSSPQKRPWHRILQLKYSKWLDNLNSIDPIIVKVVED